MDVDCDGSRPDYFKTSNAHLVFRMVKHKTTYQTTSFNSSTLHQNHLSFDPQLSYHTIPLSPNSFQLLPHRNLLYDFSFFVSAAIPRHILTPSDHIIITWHARFPLLAQLALLDSHCADRDGAMMAFDGGTKIFAPFPRQIVSNRRGGDLPPGRSAYILALANQCLCYGMTSSGLSCISEEASCE